MAITRWDPFRDILTLQNRMNSVFEDYNRREGQADSRPDPMAAAFAPPVDIYEDTHKIVLNLEAPGLKQEDFDIQVENNTLSVRGERKFDTEQKEENYHRVERRYGAFYRAFTLPQTVNTDQVQASYDAGILRIELAKRAEARPRQIKVAVGSKGVGAGSPPPSAPQQVERTASA
jgi:HSP20 family protein